MVMKALLRELARRGRAILYSTHQLEVAERLCGRVLILHEGRVLAEDTARDLESVFSAFVASTPPEATAARIAAVVSAEARERRAIPAPL
jgi:ABC-2 type transport system ATP-binding protein